MAARNKEKRAVVDEAWAERLIEGIQFDDDVDDVVEEIKGYVDGYDEDDDVDDESESPGIDYGLCSMCCSHNTIIGFVRLEINDEDYHEFEDVCVDCVLEKLIGYVSHQRES